MRFYILKNQYVAKLAGLDLRKEVTNFHTILVSYCVS